MNLKTSTFSIFRSLLTIISPKLNARVCYRIKTGKKISLNNPKTFSEKLVSLKILNYNNNPLVKQCADKYAVREYIKDSNCENILNELIAVYDKPEDIEWDKLPEQFAMKWNFGCGFNIICKDKSKLDIKDTIKKLKKWERSKYYLGYAEMQYKDVNKKIIVEKYLKTKDGSLPVDYKLYCFKGNCLAILYISDRENEKHKACFFDKEWNYLGLPEKENKTMNYVKPDPLPEKPESLDIMIKTAEILSSNFPFVRVDYYDVNGKAIFGEMTFTPAGGHDVSQISINGKNMSEYLDLKGEI